LTQKYILAGFGLLARNLAMGFSSFNFGIRAELMEHPVWQFENIPFPARVTFKNDKVVEVDIPRLP
jgi:hypothetical protein